MQSVNKNSKCLEGIENAYTKSYQTLKLSKVFKNESHCLKLVNSFLQTLVKPLSSN